MRGGYDQGGCSAGQVWLKHPALSSAAAPSSVPVVEEAIEHRDHHQRQHGEDEQATDHHNRYRRTAISQFGLLAHASADVGGNTDIQVTHIAEAVQYRSLNSKLLGGVIGHAGL